MGEKRSRYKENIEGDAKPVRPPLDETPMPVLGFDALGDDHGRKTLLEIQALLEFEDEPGESLCQ